LRLIEEFAPDAMAVESVFTATEHAHGTAVGGGARLIGAAGRRQHNSSA